MLSLRSPSKKVRYREKIYYGFDYFNFARVPWLQVFITPSMLWTYCHRTWTGKESRDPELWFQKVNTWSVIHAVHTTNATRILSILHHSMPQKYYQSLFFVRIYQCHLILSSSLVIDVVHIWRLIADMLFSVHAYNTECLNVLVFLRHTAVECLCLFTTLVPVSLCYFSDHPAIVGCLV